MPVLRWRKLPQISKYGIQISHAFHNPVQSRIRSVCVWSSPIQIRLDWTGLWIQRNDPAHFIPWYYLIKLMFTKVHTYLFPFAHVSPQVRATVQPASGSVPAAVWRPWIKWWTTLKLRRPVKSSAPTWPCPAPRRRTSAPSSWPWERWTYGWASPATLGEPSSAWREPAVQCRPPSSGGPGISQTMLRTRTASWPGSMRAGMTIHVTRQRTRSVSYATATNRSVSSGDRPAPEPKVERSYCSKFNFSIGHWTMNTRWRIK